MKALLCREYGPIDQLKVEEVPSPRPGPNEVVVEVKASSLNFPDALLVQGAEVVYDPVGGVHTEAALRATGWHGRLLVIGFASGVIPQVKLNLALLKERSLIGVYWGDWVQRDPDGQRRNVERLAAWFAQGKIRPAVSERVPLADAPAAMTRLLQRKVKGKVVVVPGA